MILALAHPYLFLRLLLEIALVVLVSIGSIRRLPAQTPPELPPREDLPQLPRPIPPEDEIPEESPQLPPPEELLPPDSPAPSDLPAIPGTITVNQFQVVGSTIFTDEQLAAATEPFEDRPLSFAELLQARSAITQLYVNNGYVTSGAIIPPQEIAEGTVRIDVVEGALAETNVDIEGRLDPDYISDRLALATQVPLNVPRLVEALQLLQLNPLVERISAELSAGVRPGTSVLDVEVEIADTFSTQIALDNGRSPSVGSFRRQVELTEANLLGLGDNFRATYRNTDGSNDFDVAYTIPVNARNGTFALSYRKVGSEVVEEPFDFLNIESEFDRYELTLRQPVIQKPTQELTLGLSAERTASVVTFLDEEVGFPESGEGITRLTTLRFFQEWLQRGQQQVFAARSQFSVGLDALDATTSDEAPDGRYFAWRGQAQWVRQLAADTLVLVRSDLQLTDDNLVALEQFGLGGIGSVRGYRQDALLENNGVLASAEVRLPILRVPSQDMVLQVVPFVDFGTVWGRSDDEFSPDTDTLAAIGIGLNYELGETFSARLDWGIPLVELEANGDTLQENGIYFSIIYTPF
ncbi:MAG: ShlB/FhaC/HecB family hemolysin secretion/activation protein [Cyanophyceae cyanobacterium]